MSEFKSFLFSIYAISTKRRDSTESNNVNSSLRYPFKPGPALRRFYDSDIFDRNVLNIVKLFVCGHTYVDHERQRVVYKDAVVAYGGGTPMIYVYDSQSKIATAKFISILFRPRYIHDFVDMETIKRDYSVTQHEMHDITITKVVSDSKTPYSAQVAMGSDMQTPYNDMQIPYDVAIATGSDVESVYAAMPNTLEGRIGVMYCGAIYDVRYNLFPAASITKCHMWTGWNKATRLPNYYQYIGGAMQFAGIDGFSYHEHMRSGVSEYVTVGTEPAGYRYQPSYVVERNSIKRVMLGGKKFVSYTPLDFAEYNLRYFDVEIPYVKTYTRYIDGKVCDLSTQKPIDRFYMIHPCYILGRYVDKHTIPRKYMRKLADIADTMRYSSDSHLSIIKEITRAWPKITIVYYFAPSADYYTTYRDHQYQRETDPAYVRSQYIREQILKRFDLYVINEDTVYNVPRGYTECILTNTCFVSEYLPGNHIICLAADVCDVFNQLSVTFRKGTLSESPSRKRKERDTDRRHIVYISKESADTDDQKVDTDECPIKLSENISVIDADYPVRQHDVCEVCYLIHTGERCGVSYKCKICRLYHPPGSPILRKCPDCRGLFNIGCYIAHIEHCGKRYVYCTQCDMAIDHDDLYVPRGHVH